MWGGRAGDVGNTGPDPRPSTPCVLSLSGQGVAQYNTMERNDLGTPVAGWGDEEEEEEEEDL